jgi:hypothetical protein
MPLPGEQVRGRRPVMPSSETETRSRGRLALDRDGASHEGGRPALERDGSPLEGAIDPRARRICTEAAPYPSSGAEFCPRGAGPIV